MGEVDSKAGASKLPDFDILWDYEHPGSTEGKFRELLPAAIDSLDISYLAELLTQIARAEAMQRKFQEAQKTLDRVEKALPKADQRVSVRYVLERGRVLSLSGKPREAQPRLREGPLYSSIGWNHFEQKKYQEALFMFQKALQYTDQLGDLLKIRTAKWSVAKVLRVIEHTEEALDMQRKLFEEYQGEGKRNGYVYEEIAEGLLVMGQAEEAEGWFAAAYTELSKDPRIARDQNRLNRLKELGAVGKRRPTPA